MKVFVTRTIPNPGIEKLKAAGYEVIISEQNGVLPRADFIERLKSENPDAVLCLLTEKIDSEVLDAAPNAKIFANYAVGFDNIDCNEVTKRGVAATNTPEVLTEAVAEHTVSLILAVGRRIVEADRMMRDSKYQGWDPLLLLGTEMHGKTLAIVGCGRIGARVAEIMHNGFGMNVAYYDRAKNDRLESAVNASFYPDINGLLSVADVVSIHLPLTDETKHSINTERLGLMKSTALLVNTARGPIVDEAALAAALKNRQITGAALDVFENEPAVHPELLTLPNVVLTPHIASATLEARDQMSIVAADNIIAVLNGQPPINPIPVVN